MWGHLQVSFCWYLVFIQYSCFPQDRVQARVQHVVSVFLQLFVVKIQIWLSQKDCSLMWSVITKFHISFAVTPSNAQPHTRPPMRINVPHHTSEHHYFILHVVNMLFSPFKFKNCLRGSQTDLPWLRNSKVPPRTKAGLQTGFFLKITSKLDRLS